MEPVSNWLRVLRYAWSIRLIILAGMLSAAEIALPLIQQFVMIPARTFLVLSIIATFGALVARLIAQKSVGGKE